MNKSKSKLISIATVLLLVFTLIGVLPALPAGAVEGTITLGKTYYSLDSDFNSVTATVTDADLNVVRQTKSRLTGTGTTFTIKDGVLEGHVTVTDEDVSSQADGTVTEFTLAKKPIGDRGTSGTTPTSATAPSGVITPDGVIDVDDVVVKVAGVVQNPASINAADGKFTLASAPAAGVTVTATYSYYEYDTTTPANTPIAAPPTVTAGGLTYGIVSYNADTGAVVVSTSVTNPIITFTFNKTDSYATTVVAVKFTSTSSATGLTKALSETGPATGIFTATATVTNDPSEVTKLFVQDGDTITATYVDASPAVTKTATAKFDKTAPTVTIVEPAHGAYATNTTPTFTVDIVDTGAGVDLATVVLTINTVDVTASASKMPIASGYRVQYWQSTAFAEGSYEWYVMVEDKVDNAPASTVRGASSSTKAKVTVDTSAPDLIEARTGIAATYDTTDAWYEDSSTASKKSIRLEYKIGTDPAKSAPLDEATIATTDYLVDGVAPAAVTLGVGNSTVKRFVYLTMATDLATGAKPVIQQTGAIADKAGNSLATDSITAQDYLVPDITVSVSPALISAVVVSTTVYYNKATITVTSSETLSAIPTVKVGGSGGTSVTMAGTTPTSWTGTYTITGDSAKLSISVTGTDVAGNAIVDPSTLATDKQIYLQQDKLAPTANVTPADSAEVQTQNPWITVVFCEGTSLGGCGGTEYSGDSYLKVTMTKATLDGVDVLSKFYTSDSIQYTMAATGLALGEHTLKVNGKDLAMNAMSSDASVTFKIVERAKTSIAVKPQWNLISVPAPVTDPAINSVLAGKVNLQKIYSYDAVAGWSFATYDAATGKWSGTLTQIVDGKGYWVYSIGFDTIKVLTLERTDPTAALPSYSLKKGWNLIGFTTIVGAADQPAINYLASVKWTSLYAYDPDPATQYTLVKPTATNTLPADYKVASGKGYWVYLSEDGLLVP